MDQHLAKLAQKKNIKHQGLETPLEQLQYFDNLSLIQQEQFLIDVILQQDDTRYSDALKEWYIKGDEQGFLKLQEEFSSLDPQQKQLDDLLIKGLLHERNKKLTKRIDILLQHQPTLQYFFAIGAGHMSGESGIVQSLRKRGYRIEKID